MDAPALRESSRAHRGRGARSRATQDSDMIRSRHLTGAVIAALLAASVGGVAVAQEPPAAAAADKSPAKVPDAGPGASPDIFLGKADAPVTVVEYASLTCSHCGAFHKETWPTLKSRYVDTGKVRFVLRAFPLDNLALAGAMLARCRGEADYYPTVDVLFGNQNDWAYASKPVDGLKAVAARAGMDGAKVESCLKDQGLLDGVVASRAHAAKELGVKSTPTFFVNGVKHEGGLTPDGLVAAIAPHLPNSAKD